LLFGEQAGDGAVQARNAPTGNYLAQDLSIALVSVPGFLQLPLFYLTRQYKTFILVKILREVEGIKKQNERAL
jgi:hypothetical protein